MQTPASIAQDLAGLLAQAAAIQDMDGHPLGPAMARDVALIAAGATRELDRHWSDAPEAFVRCPVAGQVRGQVFVSSTATLEMLEVFDRHGQKLQLESLMFLPLGPHPLRLALLPRPTTYWDKDEQGTSGLPTRLDGYGTPASRLTLAATWCDRPSVEALLSQPAGGVEAVEYPATSAQALLLGAALGSLHAARQGVLPNFIDDLSSWWFQGLANGANPSEVAWPTVQLAQSPIFESDKSWWAQPWGTGGVPLYAARSGRATQVSYQSPVCALVVLAQALTVACDRAARGADPQAIRALTRPQGPAVMLRDMLLSVPEGSVAFTEVLLSASGPEHLETLKRLCADAPRAWDLSAQGPAGWDPMGCLLERLGSLENGSRRDAAFALSQVLAAQCAATHQALPAANDDCVEKWRQVLSEAMDSVGASWSAAAAADPLWPAWLEESARSSGWMGLSPAQSEHWSRLCGLYAQALRGAPRDPGDGPGREELRMDLELIPGFAEAGPSKARPKSRL